MRRTNRKPTEGRAFLVPKIDSTPNRNFFFVPDLDQNGSQETPVELRDAFLAMNGLSLDIEELKRSIRQITFEHNVSYVIISSDSATGSIRFVCKDYQIGCRSSVKYVTRDGVVFLQGFSHKHNINSQYLNLHPQYFLFHHKHAKRYCWRQN